MNAPDFAPHAQATIVLSALDDYLRTAPDREVRISYSLEHGFRVALHEQHVSHGDSLRDAAAQVAQVLVLDAGAVSP
ncbi:MAG TPA: hypothetical protein VH062_10175 [Polyangiaceae bacterium]|jgi:hypothetical protein|nr:hypothetical protein [Polyangiaceae bacterium]